MDFYFDRVLHTISYASELQPHRAIAWFVGVVCIFGMSVNGLLGTFL